MFNVCGTWASKGPEGSWVFAQEGLLTMARVCKVMSSCTSFFFSHKHHQKYSQSTSHRILLSSAADSGSLLTAFHGYGINTQSRRQLGKTSFTDAILSLFWFFFLAITNLFPFSRQYLKELITEMWQKENDKKGKQVFPNRRICFSPENTHSEHGDENCQCCNGVTGAEWERIQCQSTSVCWPNIAHEKSKERYFWILLQLNKNWISFTWVFPFWLPFACNLQNCNDDTGNSEAEYNPENIIFWWFADADGRKSLNFFSWETFLLAVRHKEGHVML